MPRHIIPLFLLAFVAFCIATVHSMALVHFWYWSYPLLDVPMHFSGGLFIGGFILFLFASLKDYGQFLRKPVQTAFAAALIIGLGWEVFETLTGISTGGPVWYYWYDSTKDVIMDSLGGVTAGLIFPKLLRIGAESKQAY